MELNQREDDGQNSNRTRTERGPRHAPPRPPFAASTTGNGKRHGYSIDAGPSTSHVRPRGQRVEPSTTQVASIPRPRATAADDQMRAEKMRLANPAVASHYARKTTTVDRLGPSTHETALRREPSLTNISIAPPPSVTRSVPSREVHTGGARPARRNSGASFVTDGVSVVSSLQDNVTLFSASTASSASTTGQNSPNSPDQMRAEKLRLVNPGLQPHYTRATREVESMGVSKHVAVQREPSILPLHCNAPPSVTRSVPSRDYHNANNLTIDDPDPAGRRNQRNRRTQRNNSSPSTPATSLTEIPHQHLVEREAAIHEKIQRHNRVTGQQVQSHDFEEGPETPLPADLLARENHAHHKVHEHIRLSSTVETNQSETGIERVEDRSIDVPSPTRNSGTLLPTASFRQPNQRYSVQPSQKGQHNGVPYPDHRPGALAVENPEFQDSRISQAAHLASLECQNSVYDSIEENGVLREGDNEIRTNRPRDDQEQATQATSGSLQTSMDDKEVNTQSKRRFGLIALAIIVVIGAAVGVVIAVRGGSSGDDSNQIPAMEPSTAATAIPTLGVDLSVYQAIVGDLTKDASTFMDPSTPQYKALLWLFNRYRDRVMSGDATLRVEYVLAVFYFSTSQKSLWGQSNNFLSSKTICEWKDLGNDGGETGVICDETGDVVALNLSDNGLSGSIPEEIKGLSSLRAVFLRSNELSGGLPSALLEIENLAFLDVTQNVLTGTVPPAIGKASNLETLYLGVNLMEGPLDLNPLLQDPNCRLRQLETSGNEFEGTFDLSSLSANCDAIELLNIGFSGLVVNQEIPLSGLEQLWSLDLRQTSTTGTLPESIGRMSEMQTMLLGTNGIGGNIPSSIGDMAKLENLNLSFNGLVGAIPTQIGQLIQLQELSLVNNALEGTIPTELENLNRLEEARLFGNFLEGTLEFLCPLNPVLQYLAADCLSDIGCSCCTQCL